MSHEKGEDASYIAPSSLGSQKLSNQIYFSRLLPLESSLLKMSEHRLAPSSVTKTAPQPATTAVNRPQSSLLPKPNQLVKIQKPAINPLKNKKVISQAKPTPSSQSFDMTYILLIFLILAAALGGGVCWKLKKRNQETDAKEGKRSSKPLISPDHHDGNEEEQIEEHPVQAEDVNPLPIVTEVKETKIEESPKEEEPIMDSIPFTLTETPEILGSEEQTSVPDKQIEQNHTIEFDNDIFNKHSTEDQVKETSSEKPLSDKNYQVEFTLETPVEKSSESASSQRSGKLFQTEEAKIEPKSTPEVEEVDVSPPAKSSAALGTLLDLAQTYISMEMWKRHNNPCKK